MPRKFTTADGLVPEDLIHCGLDHITAAQLLFESDPGHFDAAGYLIHIGVELLLKGWLLETTGFFKDTHDLRLLYERLVSQASAVPPDNKQRGLLATLDEYANLRYPNRKHPTEIGTENLPEIEALIGHLLRSMPERIEQLVGQIDPVKKAGRVLMKKRKEDAKSDA
jgi:HEPN domain-containing protein